MPFAEPNKEGSDLSQHDPLQSIVLHLLPGVPALAAYAVFAAILVPRGWPHLLPLMMAITFAEVPVAWGVMVYLGRREPRGFSWKTLLLYRTAVPIWQYVAIGVPLILFSMILIGGVGPQVQDAIVPRFFAWLPEWFVLSPSPDSMLRLSRTALLAVWVFSFVSLTVLGGLTQEVYFRGFLLPRMTRMGAWAPAANALLFAIFHFVAPWHWGVFFLMVLPWSYVVWWKRSLRLGIFVHSGMLLLQWVGMTLLVFGVVEIPGS